MTMRASAVTPVESTDFCLYQADVPVQTQSLTQVMRTSISPYFKTVISLSRLKRSSSQSPISTSCAVCTSPM